MYLCWQNPYVVCFTGKQSPLQINIYQWWPLFPPSVDIVEDFKYLGVHIDEKLDWSKTQMHFTRKNRVASIFSDNCGPLTSVQSCWGCFMSFYGGRCFLVCCDMLGQRVEGGGRKQTQQADQEVEWCCGVGAGLPGTGIRDNVSHPLHNDLVKRRSSFSGRPITPKFITEWHRRSFLPEGIKLCSASLREY